MAIDPSIARREFCRAALRLAGLGGLLAGAAGLVCGRGDGRLPASVCLPSAACPRCPRRRDCFLGRDALPAGPGTGSAGKGGLP